MADTDQERTEQATQKKRQDERQKGNVAKSQDVVAALSLLGVVMIFVTMSQRQAEYAYTLFQETFSHPFALQTDVDSFSSYLSGQIFQILGKLFLFFTVVILTSVAGHLLQSGFLFLPNKCAPDFSRIDPFKNARKLFSLETLLNIALGCTKLGIVLLALYLSLKGEIETLISLPHGSPMQIVLYSAYFLKRLGYILCGVILAIAVGDYALKRFKWEKDIRMTPQELKEELRQESGDPIVKGKRRSMRASILNASVTPTEPTSPISQTSLYRDAKRTEETSRQDRDKDNNKR